MTKDNPLIGFYKIAPIVVHFTRCRPSIVEHQHARCDPFRVKPVSDGVAAQSGEKDITGVDQLASLSRHLRVRPTASCSHDNPEKPAHKNSHPPPRWFGSNSS